MRERVLLYTTRDTYYDYYVYKVDVNEYLIIHFIIFRPSVCGCGWRPN